MTVLALALAAIASAAVGLTVFGLFRYSGVRRGPVGPDQYRKAGLI